MDMSVCCDPNYDVYIATICLHMTMWRQLDEWQQIQILMGFTPLHTEYII